MVEFFPLLCQITNLRAIEVGQIVEVRENELSCCQGKVHQVDVGQGTVWVGTDAKPRIFNAENFTFWRYII